MSYVRVASMRRRDRCNESRVPLYTDQADATQFTRTQFTGTRFTCTQFTRFAHMKPSVKHPQDGRLAGDKIKRLHSLDGGSQRFLVGEVRDQTQLLDFAVVARVGERGL